MCWLRLNIRSRVSATVALLSAVLLGCALAAAAPVPIVPGKVRLILSADTLDKEPQRDGRRRSDIWLLRPTVPQELLTYLQNDDPANPSMVTVQLLAGGAEVVAQKVKVEAGQFVQVKWIRPGAPLLSELRRPVILRLLDGEGKKIVSEPVTLDINRPSDYLEKPVVEVIKDGQTARLIATVSPKKQFRGPPCRVELVLDPSRIPGLAPGMKTRVYARNVTRPPPEDATQGEVSVVAEGVKLQADAPQGLVTIRADGYNGAFLYRTASSETESGTRLTPIDARVLRINMPPAADSRRAVHVSVEADNEGAPDNKRLVLDVLTLVDKGDKKDVETFSQVAEFAGDRSKRFYYAVGGPRDGLLFKPEVKDWSADVDLSGFQGPTQLRLRLLEKNQKEPLTILDTEREDWKADAKDVRKTIVLDDTPPENVRFEKAPLKVVPGKPVLFVARGEDKESGIREVVFLLGKFAADGKLPPEAVVTQGTPADEDRVRWSGELLVPADQKSPLPVSVRFTNAIGLSTTKTIALALSAPPPVEKKPLKKGSIAGVVMEGDRPQVGVKVDLVNAAGRVLATATTKAGGTFGFKDLDAGDYRVSSAKVASNTKGAEAVKLADKQDKTGVTIKLWR